MAVSGSILDAEPTAEFNDACMDIIQRWEQGVLPTKDALDQIEALERKARQENHRGNQGRAEHLLGYLQHFLGNLSSSIRHYERARKLFEAVGNRRRLAIIDLNQGENYRYKGDYTRARYLYQMAYEGARETNFLNIQTIAIVNEGLILLSAHKYEAARKAFEEGYELAQQWTEGLHNLPHTLCEIHESLARTYLARGEMQRAWDHAHEAVRIAHESNLQMEIALSNRTMGDVITAMGNCPDPDMPCDANSYYAESVAILMQMNAEAELGRTLLAHGRSLANMGKRNTAVRKMQQALLIFTRLGMTADAAAAVEAQRAVMA